MKESRRSSSSTSSRTLQAPAACGPLVRLNRAISKLGLLSRSEATAAVLAGRVRVNGRVELDPAAHVDLEHAAIDIDRIHQVRAPWRTIVLHKPRGVLTTRRDPRGRRTVYDLLRHEERALVAVGRLDQATTGLLILTTDTELAAWLTDPLNHVRRVYVVTVRGRVTPDEARVLEAGIDTGGEHLHASAVTLRKASGRESHLTVVLEEGKNREVRRLCEAIGHPVTRLKRVAFGGVELGSLAPGSWQDVTYAEMRAAFPNAPWGRGAGTKPRSSGVVWD